jgi:photosystem II stability/assembly factor-like uncharacterized protein
VPAVARLGFIAVALGLFLIAVLTFVPPVRNRFFPPAKGPDGDNATNGGDLSRPHWTVLPGPSGDKDEPFDRIAFPTRDVGYLASRKAVYRTRDGAKTWEKLKLADVGRVHVLHFTDTKTGWLGTDRLRKTADGGETWADESLGGVTMRSVTALALHPDGWAVAGGTTADGKLALFRRDSAGGGWVELDPAGGLEPYANWSVAALAVTGAKSGLAVLLDGAEGGGVVLLTADGSRSWQKSFPVAEDLYRLSVDRHGRGWLSGFRGFLWHTTERGDNWTRQENPDADQATPTTLAFDPDGKLGLAPLWKGKVLMKRGSEPWTVHAVPLGYALPHAVVVDPGCAYVLGADGAVARLLGAPAVSDR